MKIIYDRKTNERQLHLSAIPVRQLSDSLSVEVIEKSSVRFPCFGDLCQVLEGVGMYQHLSLDDFCPDDARHRYDFLQKMKRGIDIPVVMLTYSPGNNQGNLHFIWKYESMDVEKVFQNSLPVVETIKPLLPQYHTHAMRASLLSKFGWISPKIPSAALRNFYKSLTGDCSAASNLTEMEIDKRVQLVLEMEPEEPSTIFDLHALNSSQDRAKFDAFWEQCSMYLNEFVGTAVDDRRHSEVVHLAQAISVRDLRNQVQKRCPEGTAIPSLEWIRLQFWPKSQNTKAATHYTGRLNIKFMVQRNTVTPTIVLQFSDTSVNSH